MSARSTVVALAATIVLVAGSARIMAQSQTTSDQPRPGPSGAQQLPRSALAKSSPRPITGALASRLADGSKVATKPSPPCPEPGPTAITPAPEEKGYRVRDEFGRCVVARLFGRDGDAHALLMPDGQLGTVKKLIPADEPFQPDSIESLREVLHNGPFAEYHVLQTDHYLIFYQSTAAFARDSGRLLEDQYKGLLDTFRRHGITVHESEFPLVAVIFETERDFREHKTVPLQVQAYYEYFTNRIFFYQKSERDELEPKVAALLKPQTVAHEGAHQILANIGVQPRASAWPPWLIEGLAEYCATTVTTKKGITWSGMGAVNCLHMATMRELDDPLSTNVDTGGVHAVKVARRRPTSVTESLLTKTALTPTDYARAWALAHYLAQKRGPDFVNFLKVMGLVPAYQDRTPEQNLAEFRKIFGDDLNKVDKKVDEHIRKLVKKGGYDPLPWYAVFLAQDLGNGLVHRAATFSQSPQVIQAWVQEQTHPMGGAVNSEVATFPTRDRAFMAAEAWMRNY